MPDKVTIPIADLALLRSSCDQESLSFLETWDGAFRTLGFVFLTNHGLEPLFQTLHEQARHFFQLPTQQKLSFRVSQDYGHGGYTPQGQENVSRSYLEGEKAQRPPDAVESLASSKSRLDHFPGKDNGYATDDLRSASQILMSELNLLTIEVMEIMATCLGLPPNHFLRYYENGRANNDIRIARYLRSGGSDEKALAPQLRYGEHTDYTGFTFLWRSGANGLQCLNTAATNRSDVQSMMASWLDIPVLEDHPDALIVNAGDLIQRWTNNYWISNVHRVLAAPGPGLEQEEPISVVFFTGPHHDTKVSVLSQSPKVAAMGDVDKAYAAELTAGEHLWQKVNASNQ